MQGAFDQTCIGFGVLAERDHTRDVRFLGAAFEMRELRDVAIDDGGAVFLQSEKDLGLGVGNFGQGTEKFEMHRRDSGDDRHMRAREAGQRLDLAGVVHAHFQHGIMRTGRTARERQRHAPMIVVGSDRCVGFAVLRQRKPQRFLGAGLADRTGDADHLGVRARPRRGGERAQRGENVGHDKKRRILRHVGTPLGGDNGESGFGGERSGNEFVAVAAVRRMAKNASPSPMVRVSIERPEIVAGSVPCRSAPIAAAMSSTVHSAGTLMRQAPSVPRRPLRDR